MFSRCLLCLDVDQEPRAAATALTELVGHLRSLHVQAILAGPARHWIHGLIATESPDLPNWSLAELIRETAGAGDEVTAEVTWELDSDALRDAATEQRAECVAFGPVGKRLPRRISQLAAIANRCRLPVLWLGAQRRRSAGRRILVPYEDDARRAARSVTFLRARTEPGDLLVLLALGQPDPRLREPSAVSELAGLRGGLESDALRADLTNLHDRLEAYLAEHPADLVVVAPEAMNPLTVMASAWFGWDTLAERDPALLILPESPSEEALPGELDAPDVLLLGGSVRIAAARRSLLGNLVPVERAVHVVGRGRLLAMIDLSDGASELELPAGGEALTALGLGREATDSKGALSHIEELVRVVDPGQRPLVLLDTDLNPEHVTEAVTLCAATASEALCLAVRLRTEVSCTSIRAMLATAGAAMPVVDANVLLNVGDSNDAPSEAQGLRLARVASYLRLAGLTVAAVVPASSPLPLDGRDRFRVLSPETLAELPAAIRSARTAPTGDALDRALTELTGAAPSTGNAVSIELDNQRARERLLALIRRCQRRLHLQTYIVHDDAFSQALQTALRDAAQRGVRVRFLADSLYSAHGSFGQRNAWLERLAAVEGIEVLVGRPLNSLPSLLDLKLRSHRKLIVGDGETAIVSGRNLASTYFTSFAEVDLTPATPWEQVPWLDSGALLEGPLVAAVEQSFLNAWRTAGGEPFSVTTPPAAGPTTARLVLHDGLQDAHTLDAYLALIRAASSRLTLVNTFPLAQELEHALLQAIARGVRVRVLIGNIRPKHGAERTPFPEANPAREIGDQLVRGHLDALVSAGAEVFELTLQGLAGWAPELKQVWPHVHAKLLTMDGRVCTVGSANLDVTAGYWESEALLVVEDEQLTQRLDEELDALTTGSPRLLPEDPAWQEGASRRAWLRRHWPRLLG